MQSKSNNSSEPPHILMHRHASNKFSTNAEKYQRTKNVTFGNDVAKQDALESMDTNIYLQEVSSAWSSNGSM